ncbi:MAG: thiaminase II, partial [Rhodospirillaceae bacterium]|nr:thiaminase II [Rhodospirillaceae bacterium]
WIDMYGGAAYQEIAAEAVQYLDIIAEARNVAARQADLIATFRQATRLETDFWQVGLDAARA